MKDEYLTIADSASSVYRDRGSKFIGIVYHIDSEDCAKDKLKELKKEYHDARHICYAYKLGANGDIWRANDDGEPAGSAGNPILGQLNSAGVSDVLAVVVRYFGGTKLGIPGLIKAYKTATKEAIDSAGTRTTIVSKLMLVEFPFVQTNIAMRIINETGAEIIESEYTETCQLVLKIRESDSEMLMMRLNNQENITCTEKF